MNGTPVSDDAPQPPDAELVRQRWIPRRDVEWARDCNQILNDYGTVQGSNTYEKQHVARHRAVRLIRLLVELRMQDRGNLGEHVDRTRDDRFMWSVELKRSDRGRPPATA